MKFGSDRPIKKHLFLQVVIESIVTIKIFILQKILFNSITVYFVLCIKKHFIIIFIFVYDSCLSYKMKNQLKQYCAFFILQLIMPYILIYDMVISLQLI